MSEWIKIEHPLPDKPEVHTIAQILDLDPDTVVGKLIRIWIWVDQQSRDHHVASVTIKLIDRLAFRDGFGDAMISAGWLTEGDGLNFPNFERHNGETSKKRAMSKDRSRKYRDGLRDDQRDDPVIRKEKKRKEKRSSTGGRSKEDDLRAKLKLLWNDSVGTTQFRDWTLKRKNALLTRLKDSKWDWEAALLKFPLPWATDPNNWQPTIDWFLKPDTVTKLIEGAYDKNRSSIYSDDGLGDLRRFAEGDD